MPRGQTTDSEQSGVAPTQGHAGTAHREREVPLGRKVNAKGARGNRVGPRGNPYRVFQWSQGNQGLKYSLVNIIDVDRKIHGYLKRNTPHTSACTSVLPSWSSGAWEQTERLVLRDWTHPQTPRVWVDFYLVHFFKNRALCAEPVGGEICLRASPWGGGLKGDGLSSKDNTTSPDLPNELAVWGRGASCQPDFGHRSLFRI